MLFLAIFYHIFTPFSHTSEHGSACVKFDDAHDLQLSEHSVLQLYVHVVV